MARALVMSWFYLWTRSVFAFSFFHLHLARCSLDVPSFVSPRGLSDWTPFSFSDGVMRSVELLSCFFLSWHCLDCRQVSSEEVGSSSFFRGCVAIESVFFDPFFRLFFSFLSYELQPFHFFFHQGSASLDGFRRVIRRNAVWFRTRFDAFFLGRRERGRVPWHRSFVFLCIAHDVFFLFLLFGFRFGFGFGFAGWQLSWKGGDVFSWDGSFAFLCFFFFFFIFFAAAAAGWHASHVGMLSWISWWLVSSCGLFSILVVVIFFSLVG